MFHQNKNSNEIGKRL
uniref:Uncharacterized protein n=1 Tax=Rhizophora mucronata TaxID=61149 RepID=A0A2P2JJ81_RHIMU